MEWQSSLKLTIKNKYIICFPTYMLLLILNNNISAQSSIYAKLKYEQFDSEILIYTSILNKSEAPHSLNIFMDSESSDFSNNLIKKSSVESLNLASKERTFVNLTTVEFSVLAETNVFLRVEEDGVVLWKDTLELEFPNKFRSVTGKDVEIDLGGLKIDRTRTPLGRSFFEKFEKNWISPPGNSDYSITFEELPFRFRTTILKVYLDNEKIMETYLRDDSEFLDQLTDYVIGTIKQKLFLRKQRDDELGGNFNGI